MTCPWTTRWIFAATLIAAGCGDDGPPSGSGTESTSSPSTDGTMTGTMTGPPPTTTTTTPTTTTTNGDDTSTTDASTTIADDTTTGEMTSTTEGAESSSSTTGDESSSTGSESSSDSGGGAGVTFCTAAGNECELGEVCRTSFCCKDQVGFCVPADPPTCGGLIGTPCNPGLECLTEICIADGLGECVTPEAQAEICAAQPNCWACP